MRKKITKAERSGAPPRLYFVGSPTGDNLCSYDGDDGSHRYAVSSGLCNCGELSAFPDGGTVYVYELVRVARVVKHTRLVDLKDYEIPFQEAT